MTPYRRVIEVTVPYESAYSKNAHLKMSRGGRHLYIPEDVKQRRQALEDALRNAGGEWYEGKMWIHVHVARPDNRVDAVNFVDVICDTVQRVTGINDRWYAIEGVNWELNKRDPHITVRVSQDITENQRYCMDCSRLLPASSEHFWASTSDPFGLMRRCKPCHRLATGLLKKTWNKLQEDGHIVLPSYDQEIVHFYTFKDKERFFVRVDTHRPGDTQESRRRKRMELVDLAHDCGAVPVLVTRGMKFEVLGGDNG